MGVVLKSSPANRQDKKEPVSEKVIPSGPGCGASLRQEKRRVLAYAAASAFFAMKDAAMAEIPARRKNTPARIGRNPASIG